MEFNPDIHPLALIITILFGILIDYEKVEFSQLSQFSKSNIVDVTRWVKINYPSIKNLSD